MDSRYFEMSKQGSFCKTTRDKPKTVNRVGKSINFKIMATNYSISISLDDTTLSDLQQNGYALQVFKGAKGNSTSACPTVWTSVTKFSSDVTISWVENYGAYVDNQTVANGVVVNIGSFQPMDLGDTMTLAADGSTSVSTVGTSGAISIVNEQQSEWLCGMTQSANGSAPTATCAFPLFGAGSVDLMEPYESLVLVFASAPVATGTVVEEALSSSVTVTLSGSETEVALSFDMNTGWDTNGNPYAKVNPDPINLAQTLIVPIS